MIAPIALFALAITAQQPPISNPCANGYSENVWDPRFTPGQRWSYRARPLDQDSTLTITKVDYVPALGTVVQIMVDHVDFDDKPGDRPHNNHRTEYFAIRRDSLDASALEMIGISQVVGQPNYRSWQTNCAGLTYGTTVADTLTTLQDEYLARQYPCVMQITLDSIPSGEPKRFTLTLTQSIVNDPFPLRALDGHLTFRNGTPVKDAGIEITAYDYYRNPHPITLKTGSAGTFSIPKIPLGTYDFKLTLDGFQSQFGTLSVTPKRPSLSKLHPEN